MFLISFPLLSMHAIETLGPAKWIRISTFGVKVVNHSERALMRNVTGRSLNGMNSVSLSLRNQYRIFAPLYDRCYLLVHVFSPSITILGSFSQSQSLVNQLDRTTFSVRDWRIQIDAIKSLSLVHLSSKWGLPFLHISHSYIASHLSPLPW